MKPLALFQDAWDRCAHLTAIHAYLAQHAAPALRCEEVLRAESAARVSALDLYVHEVVAQGMVSIFDGIRPATPQYLRHRLSTEALNRIRKAASPQQATAFFDLEVREQIGRDTYQFPEDVAEGIRLVSTIELWNSVVVHLGATPQQKDTHSKQLKLDLTLAVRRRNSIVHEADLQPTSPRVTWPISQADVAAVTSLVEKIVSAIDAVL
jgi:hypothetical protein